MQYTVSQLSVAFRPFAGTSQLVLSNGQAAEAMQADYCCPLCGQPSGEHKFLSLMSSVDRIVFGCPELPTPTELLAEVPLEEE